MTCPHNLAFVEATMRTGDANETIAPGHIWGTAHGMLHLQSYRSCTTQATWQIFIRSWTSTPFVATLKKQILITKGTNTIAQGGQHQIEGVA